MIEWLRRLASTPFRDRIAVYNGVAVRDRMLFAQRDWEPEHKRQLTQAALNATKDGDRVIVVGGGRGIVPTVLARHGRDVTVYEAASEMCERLRETRRLNGVYYSIEHAVVGAAGGDVYGDTSSARHIGSVDSLDGDALVLDCEGAETSILPADNFDAVIVETHPEYNASTNDVVATMPNSTIAGPDEISGDVVVQQ